MFYSMFIVSFSKYSKNLKMFDETRILNTFDLRAVLEITVVKFCKTNTIKLVTLIKTI